MPNHVSRLFVSRAMFASLIVCAVGGALAQSPYEFPKNTTETELQEVVVPLSDAVKRKIADALARDAQPVEPGGSTGDPILDDVLNVIRRQGSVLDGTSLDSRAEFGSTTPQNQPASGQSPPPSEPIPFFPDETSASISSQDARFHVAESLLRAARELAALPGRDQQRIRLIAAMREQATVLMIDEFSQSTSEQQ
jgi:hypothetical protein